MPLDISQIGFDDGKTWNKWPAHAFSKAAGVLFTYELAKRLKDKGVSAFCVNPGCKCLIAFLQILQIGAEGFDSNYQPQ